jgi:hypothetical protein
MDSETKSGVETRIISKKGVSYYGRYFGSYDLAGYVGETVTICEADQISNDVLVCSIGDYQFNLVPWGSK